jgi:hypothetical protein
VQFVCVMCLIASQFCIFLVKLDKPKHVLIEEQSGSIVPMSENLIKFMEIFLV